MDIDFFKYLQQLEMMAFFSGFPLLYATVIVAAGYLQKHPQKKKKLISLLSYSYAIAGTLFIGLQIRNFYPHYDFETIRSSILHPALFLWACLSILFWLPVINKRVLFSLLHSLVFFFLLLKDLFENNSQSYAADKSKITNDMKIYTDSLLLNAGIYLLLVLVLFVLIPFIKKLKALGPHKLPNSH